MSWNSHMEVHYNNISYPYNTAGIYKFGQSEPDSTSYCHYSGPYESNHQEPPMDEHRRPSEGLSAINEQMAVVSTEWGEGISITAQDNSVEGPRRHQNSHDYWVIWQDNIDPDNMTYEELLELGEAVGTLSRGLSQEQISSLPTSKYKGLFFLRKKSHGERWNIRGDKRITLPCKHAYHARCGTKWLSINKACPICSIEVFADPSKHK